jgi:large subunit ribosomal protein L19
MSVVAPKKTTSPVNVDERKNLDIRPGDIVRVHQKIQEKGKTRIQKFEGLVLAKKHGTEAGATFTVRASMSGIGVEKIFPLYSPLIDKIEIIRRSTMRRAKLYYIRAQAAKAMRKSLSNMRSVAIATKSEREEAEREAAEAEALKAEQERLAKEEAEKKAAESATPSETEAEAGKEAKAAEATKVEAPTETPSEEPKAE